MIQRREYLRPHAPDTITPDRDDWTLDALCSQIGDLALFYPEKGGNSAQAAKDICTRCPVIDTCLEAALARPEHDDHGIWGGTSPRQRRDLRRHRRTPTSTTNRTSGEAA